MIERSAPNEPVITTAPTLCIEVMQEGDTFESVQTWSERYLAMGVKSVWIINPTRRRVWSANSDGFFKVRDEALTAEGTPIRLVIADVFAELDELQSI